MIADEVIEITDKELRDYESTGRKMEAPKMSAKVKAIRVAEFRAKHTGGGEVSAPATTMPEEKPAAVAEKPRPVLDIPVIKKLFVHIKTPDNHDALLALKQTCGNYVGKTDIILVLGADKKSAIKLPFRVDASDALIGDLVKLLGEDCVVLK
jgi:hypothetical protein